MSLPDIAAWITALATALQAVATAVGAVATFLAVVAALVIAIWGDWLRSLAARPRLTISISMKAPDCVRIQTTGPNILTGQVLAFYSYYFRLSIGNDGNVAASNVEVRALNLQRHDLATNQFADDPAFMPLNLIWSNVGGTVMAKIDPQLPKHCDLAHVDAPASTHIQLATEVVPNQVAPGVWPTVKPAGNYRLRVAATADNSKPLYRVLHIVFDGNWYPQESAMFSNGVVVTVGT